MHPLISLSKLEISSNMCNVDKQQAIVTLFEWCNAVYILSSYFHRDI